MTEEEYQHYLMLMEAIKNSDTVKKIRQYAYNFGVLLRKCIPLLIMYWFYKITDNFSGVFWGYVLCQVLQILYNSTVSYLTIDKEETEKDFLA